MSVEKMIEDEVQAVRAQPTASVGKMKQSAPLLKHGARPTRVTLIDHRS